MEEEGFGYCLFIGVCEVECLEGIFIVNIVEMNVWYLKVRFFG